VNLVFSHKAWEQFCLLADHDPKLQKKIRALLKECLKTPFTGTGKPEPLKHDLSGYWSRRITHEHRLVYTVSNNDLVVVQCCYHYG
jgi:toxin YoeB